MKKFLSLLLSIIMLLCFTACNENTSKTYDTLFDEYPSVFVTENITSITFYAYYGGGKGSKVPTEYMTEIINWLHSFYKWLSETKHRTELIAEKPIFIDQDGKASAAFDEDEQLILFLPVENIIGYRVVHPDLLKNPETAKFIEDVGIKEPSLRDRIYNIILRDTISQTVSSSRP